MLIGKAAAAAAPNGKMLVQDFTVDEDRTGPPFPPLFPVNMLAGTEAGDTYTESEVRQWMEKVRLRHVDRKDIPFRTSPIIGTKEGDERRGRTCEPTMIGSVIVGRSRTGENQEMSQEMSRD